MQGSTAILGLLAALLWGSVAAPERDEALQKCLRACGESSSTDAETCRLQCRQRAERGEAPIEHWKREELKGGSPDPNVEGGSTTTTVKRGPHGTTTTVERTDRSGRTTVTHHAGSEPVESTPRVPLSIAVRLQAWCWAGCSTRPSFAARTTCRTRCPGPSTAEAPRVVEPPTPNAKADPAACRSACATRGERCKDACPTRGSDRATCALQCDEGERACSKKC